MKRKTLKSLRIQTSHVLFIGCDWNSPKGWKIDFWIFLAFSHFQRFYILKRENFTKMISSFFSIKNIEFKTEETYRVWMKFAFVVRRINFSSSKPWKPTESDWKKRKSKKEISSIYGKREKLSRKKKKYLKKIKQKELFGDCSHRFPCALIVHWTVSFWSRELFKGPKRNFCI